MLKNENSNFDKLYNVFIHLIVLALSVFVILLSQKNKLLVEMLGVGEIEQIELGDKISGMSFEDFFGNEFSLLFPKTKKSLIIIFSTTCPYCTQSIPVWKSVFEKYNKEINILGISEDSKEAVKNYALENDISFPIYFPIEEGFSRHNKIYGVPYMILLNEEGIVEHIWRGLLKENILDEIIAALSSSNKHNK